MAKLIALVKSFFKKEEIGDGSFVRLEDPSPEGVASRIYAEIKAAREYNIAA